MNTSFIQRIFIKYLHAPWSFGKKEFQKLIDWLNLEDTFRVNNIFLRLNSKNYIDRKLLFDGSFDPMLEQCICKLKENDTFLDIGANYGYFSILAASYGASVLSIEPSTRELRRFYTNLTLNPTLIGKITLFPFALAETTRTARLRLASEKNTGQNFIVNDSQSCHTDTQIFQKRFEDIIPSQCWESIVLVKIDVEGFEAQVLKSLSPLLQCATDLTLYIEMTPAYLQDRGLTTVSEIYGILNKYGFETLSKWGSSSQWDELFVKKGSLLMNRN
jgi:FkbM family methyltransferase